jgi:hypothetical protein
MESIQKTINENPDSLELGTPSKGGAIKVYGDYNNLDSFKAKIDNAVILRAYANEKLGGSDGKQM